MCSHCILQYRDLSNNRLSGLVPDRGSFSKFTPISFDNNLDLCGPVTGNPCPGSPPFSPPPPPLVPTASDSVPALGRNGTTGPIAAGVAAGAALLFAAPAIALAWWCHRKPQDLFFDVPGDDPEVQLELLKRFSLRDLQVATDTFSNKHILGRGGFGKVYKGRLADGSLVAVKRLKEDHTPGEELQFQREVEMISLAVHRNLLRLIGFCMTPTERLLVYPYMANGSVASCLRERSPSQPSLDWPTRKRIALGSARGLSYLHDHCNPKIIHRDVKAANILLDEEFEAVVGDFGLAKLMDRGKTHVTTAVRGTIGHIAPEYLSAGMSSEKSDVFAYGIMLLELITGQKPLNLVRLACDNDAMLLDWVKGRLNDKQLELLVDPDLQNIYVEAEVEQLIQVALLCMQGSPVGRPMMSEVVRMLQGDDGLAERWDEWQKVVEVVPLEAAVHLNNAADLVVTETLQEDELSAPRSDPIQLFARQAPIQPDTTTIIIDNSWNYGPYDPNELIEAARFYLSTKIGPENKQFRVGKFHKKKRFATALVGGETVVDVFDGEEMEWHLPHAKGRRMIGRAGGIAGRGLIGGEGGGDASDDDSYGSSDLCYRLTFQSRNREKVLNRYLRHVYQVFEEMCPELQLFTWCWSECLRAGGWRPMESRHPKTFDTIAMDGELKRSIVDDLERFVARRDFYKKNGDPWKRGYLLYGPPGTGKSSVVAAMSNHLKFNLYVMELGNIRSDYELRHALLLIQNKSIVVFEDIDCCPELHARSDSDGNDESTDLYIPNDGSHHKRKNPAAKFTLSTMLNCIDGVWSSHGEERIIVFTTNHKDVLDPALIRPGRMDMHIHLSYCTPEAFRSLAAIYLEVERNHPLLEEIGELLQTVDVTPAALAEELRKGSDGDVILQQVVDFLNQKKLGKGEKKNLMGGSIDSKPVVSVDFAT